MKKDGVTRTIIRNDCFCEGYLHEKRNYDRPGLKEKKLNAGDEVEVKWIWSNMYGVYFRVVKDGIQYDIAPGNIVWQIIRSATITALMKGRGDIYYMWSRLNLEAR